jgi:bacterial/archaeal transporter family-2 protein
MNGYIMSVFLAVLAGLMSAVQGTVNAGIGKTNGQYVMIIGVSIVQAIVSGIILLKNGWPPSSSNLFSPWMILAGILGVGIMFGVSSSIGSIDPLTVYVLVILGQIITSAVINHFGILGVPRMPVTPQKIASILIILLGVYCLSKTS